jgi:hypothetical protein
MLLDPQVAAQRLAVCNDIGEAAYVDSLIAAAFVVRCKLLPSALKLMDVLRERYRVDPEVTFVGHCKEYMCRMSHTVHGLLQPWS